MTSYNDLKRAGQKVFDSIEDGLERRSDEKAQDLVNRFNQTRGLWALLHIGIFVGVLVSVGTFVGVKFGLSTGVSMIVGAVAGVVWWKADFTITRPFISSVLAFIASVGFLSMAGK